MSSPLGKVKFNFFLRGTDSPFFTKWAKAFSSPSILISKGYTYSTFILSDCTQVNPLWINSASLSMNWTPGSVWLRRYRKRGILLDPPARITLLTFSWAEVIDFAIKSMFFSMYLYIWVSNCFTETYMPKTMISGSPSSLTNAFSWVESICFP